MLRKTSALAFMLVMTLLITLKHPVLGYCLCVGSYFTDNCTCEVVKKSTAVLPSACDDACCFSTQTETKKSPPCNDCTKRLNIDVSDFVWNASDHLPDLDHRNFTDLPIYSTDSHHFSELTAISANAPIRGGPPPWLSLDISQNLPIYLRHSVLII